MSQVGEATDGWGETTGEIKSSEVESSYLVVGVTAADACPVAWGGVAVGGVAAAPSPALEILVWVSQGLFHLQKNPALFV